MTTLSLQARQDFLEKDARVSDPLKGIAEFVWNALDADAGAVQVELVKNDLGGITAIWIVDDGHGISRERADHDFANLGDSIKRKMSRTRTHERAVHGKEGRGRLKFFSITRLAKWHTVYKEGEKRFAFDLTIQSNNLEHCELTDAVETDAPTGTVVELVNLKEPFDRLGSSDAFENSARSSPPISSNIRPFRSASTGSRSIRGSRSTRRWTSRRNRLSVPTASSTICGSR